MNKYESIFFPALRRFDPESAHEQTVRALSVAQSTGAGRVALRRLAGTIPAQPVECAGLRFPNPLGLAGGFDKDARVVGGLAMLGFGHIEIGTLTPRSQAGNPRPRIFRLLEDEALINRMGFPNGGLEAVVPRLRVWRQKPFGALLGVSLGKQKETPLEDAAADYLAVLRATYTYADYLAVNVSSPNTPGLRELQGGRYLEHLLKTLVAEARALAGHERPKPLFIKIAPDLTWDEIDEVLSAIETAGADGLIATNTTLTRDGLHAEARSEAGGLSGRPLRERSRAVVAHASRQTNGRLPIIGVGGIASADDARAMLDAGANLVQLYTALVYGGPGLPGRLLRGLAEV